MTLESILDTLDYDLPHSTSFLKQLPALANAFDAEKMKNILQETLFDAKSRPGANAGYKITDCKPGKALYLPDHSCNMQFDLKILDTTTNETIHTLINARLFNDLAACRRYLREALVYLSFMMAGRSEIKRFVRPVAVIESLKMTLSVFPLDGMLHALPGATDLQRMVIVLNRTLPEAITGEFLIRDVHLDLAHYGRFERCVLRYGIDGEQADTRALRHLVVYGKVDADQQGGLTDQVIKTLREKLSRPNLPYYFRVPVSYGYLPELNLLLMEALPGEPVIQRLIKEGKDESEGHPEATWQIGNLTIEESMEACARILLTLHSSGIKVGQNISLQTKAFSVIKEIQTMQQVFPELGDQFRNWIDEIMDYAQSLSAMPLCLSHGDYTYTQVIFDSRQGGLVDFDTICQAEPALDLAQFIAYLRLAMRKEHSLLGDSSERLCNTFLDAYIAGSRDWVNDEILLRQRVAIYELISLIRLMVHSWKKLKGSRLKLALSLFEERYACLKQIS